MENNSMVSINSLFDNLSMEDCITVEALSEIAFRLREARADLGISQEQFAERLGISQGMLSRYENGMENISIKKLAKLFGKLDIFFKLDFETNRYNFFLPANKGGFNTAPKEAWVTAESKGKVLCYSSNEKLELVAGF